MRKDEFTRTKMLLGDAALRRLELAVVAVFGLGGVGGSAAEALARSGVGRLILFDNDIVDITNINRQTVALHSTLGMHKTDVMKQKILDINPRAQVETHPVFYDMESAGLFDFAGYDYIIDAIDTVSSKLLLIERAHEAGVPIISAMGAGNKLDPTRLEVADIYHTSMCPLAKVMRRELRKKGVTALKVVYSKEPPIRPGNRGGQENERKKAPGSVAFVPPAAGLVLAGEVVRELVVEIES